jgi:hypothetical protein
MQKILLLLLMFNMQLMAQDTALAFYEGRTACREMLPVLNIPDREECAKRKLALELYVDKVTHLPTIYKIRGMDIRSGTGKWSIEKGIPGHPEATVYRLDMGEASMLLMKGDEQVLFILDKQKNFLVGNAQYSYTLNRVKNNHSWDKWRELIHSGASF